ncbi:hypothetical protein ACIFOE_07790 [Paenibacillus sp. NRS-1783]|uniref:hypothetical protein n=1 Tax=Paenibacillus sp. NRS-1783 TaxID=3233907 RepID=UPI003D2CBEF0
MLNIIDKCTNRDGYQMIYVNPQRNELSHNEWQKDINKHLSMYQTLKNKEEISYDDLLQLSKEGLSFWIKVLNTNCYKTSNVLIELTLSYVNKEITYYITRETYNKIINQDQEAMKMGTQTAERDEVKAIKSKYHEVLKWEAEFAQQIEQLNNINENDIDAQSVACEIIEAWDINSLSKSLVSIMVCGTEQ